MPQIACPVDVICVCSTDGSIRPLRLQLADDSKQLIRINIDQILDTKHIPYSGIEAQIFVCRGTFADKQILFELKYTIRSHSWQLLRKICG